MLDSLRRRFQKLDWLGQFADDLQAHEARTFLKPGPSVGPQGPAMVPLPTRYIDGAALAESPARMSARVTSGGRDRVGTHQRRSLDSGESIREVGCASSGVGEIATPPGPLGSTAPAP